MKRIYRVVIDTNVLISALRSRRGASFKLLSLVGTGRFVMNISVPLVLEYETTARKTKWEGKPAWNYIADILDYLCQEGEQQQIHFLWRPRAKDPKDDMILELAVAGNCDFIITYNKKDLREANAFGIKLLDPKEFLIKLGEIQ